MFGKTFATFEMLSLMTVNPIRSSKAMHDFLSYNLKKTNMTQTENILTKLLENKCGTTPVMKWLKVYQRIVRKVFQKHCEKLCITPWQVENVKGSSSEKVEVTLYFLVECVVMAQ